MAVFAVSLPLNDKNEPKDEINDEFLNGLPLIDHGNSEHKLEKRLSVITSGHAFAERNRKASRVERELTTETSKPKRKIRDLSQPSTTPSPQPERKSRDVSKPNDPPTNKKDDQHRIARDTTEDKPKRVDRDVSVPSPNDPTTRKQPEKPIPLQKRDIQKDDGKSDSNKHVETPDNIPSGKHTLNVRSTVEEKKVPEKPVPKTITKRDVKEDKDPKSQPKDTKKQLKYKKVLDQ